MSTAMLARKPETAPAKAAAKTNMGGLRIGEPDDSFEREADRVADAVMTGARPRPQWSFSKMSVETPLRRKCACGGSAGAGGECEECKEKKLLQRKPEARSSPAAAPPIVETALASPGRPLDRSARTFFEPRFGADFGAVRIHDDDVGARSACAVGALAYTVGDHIAFKAGAYDPNGMNGRRLLAHELAHVLQQSPSVLRRAPDAAALKEFDARVEKLKKDPAFKAIKTRKAEALEILKIIRKRDDALDNLTRFESIFQAPATDPKVQAPQREAEIETASVTNKGRIEQEKKAGKPRDQIEEARSAEKGRVFHKAKGRDGIHTFEIDDRDVSNIAIKVKVQLVVKSKDPGAAKAMANIKSLEDAIEKRASTWGYNVDLIFVDKGGPDVFTVPVVTGAWPTEGNFSGDDAGNAHELHHLLGLGDRYDYREHATNQDMSVDDRIYWFLQEFKIKKSNEPESIMADATHSPLDDDVCMVAGRRKQADIDACVKQRKDARSRILAGATQLAADSAAKANDIVGNDAKLTTGFDRSHIIINLLGEHFGVDRTRGHLSRIAAMLKALAKTDLSSPQNIRLVSELIAGCENESPVAATTGTPLQLCPPFFEIGPAEQARALLLEAAHQDGIGDATADTPCKTADCAKPCGDSRNAYTWVKFIECMART